MVGTEMIFEWCSFITGSVSAWIEGFIRSDLGAEVLLRLTALDTERVRGAIRLELCLEYVSHDDDILIDIFNLFVMLAFLIV